MQKRWKFIWKRTAACILCAGLFLTQPAFVFAAEDAAVVTATPVPEHTESYNQKPDTDAIAGWPAGPKIEAEAAILMDLSTDTTLYSKNADKQLYPASITKIMTALLACENLDTQKQITISQEAAFGIESGSSSIYADTDEVFTVEQALMALMLESANEIALALAEEVSGSVKKFTELMNQRATQLGCTNTHFNNPHGLPDETHYTSALDMARIARAAWLNPLFRKFATKDLYEIPPTNKQPETRYLLNHHKMMAGRERAYEGVLGGKTGYTEVSGHTLVTYAKRGNQVLMAVVLKSINGAYADTAALLDYGFSSFEVVKIPTDKKPVPVKFLPSEKYLLKNNGNTYPFYYLRNVYVTVPTGTDVSTLKRKQAVLYNAAGPYLLRSKYYIDNHAVGRGLQYEKNILSDLLLVS